MRAEEIPGENPEARIRPPVTLVPCSRGENLDSAGRPASPATSPPGSTNYEPHAWQITPTHGYDGEISEEAKGVLGDWMPLRKIRDLLGEPGVDFQQSGSTGICPDHANSPEVRGY